MNYKTKLSYLESSTILKNTTKNSINYILYNIFENTKFNFIMNIVEDNFDLDFTENEIKFYSQDIEIIKFPEWNTIQYDVNSPSIEIQSKRMETLYKLINYDKFFKNKKVLLIITKNTLNQKIINKENYSHFNFQVDQNLSIEEIKNILEENCYQFTETSKNLGDFSINSNVVDLITFNNQAYRMIIKNDIIVEIKAFNPDTQISFDNFNDILLLPIKEIIFNQNNIQNFKNNYRTLFDFDIEKDKLYNAISNSEFYNGLENWLPLFYNNELFSIFDYLPKNAVITHSSNLDDNLQTNYLMVEKYYNLRLEEKKTYNPINIDLLYLNNHETIKKIDSFINIIFDLDDIIKDKNLRYLDLEFQDIPNFYKESKEVFKSLQEFL